MTNNKILTPGIPRPFGKPGCTGKTNFQDPHWLRALLNATHGPAFLILVNNDGESETSKRKTDDELAKIAVMQAKINNENIAGKEISALKDVAGYPPFTFSKVSEYHPETSISLSQNWEDEGMPTLLQFPIYTPESEEEQRTAVLYGTGNKEELDDLEEIFLLAFQPKHYIGSFGPALDESDESDEVTRFFIQWSLFNEEAAQALGVSADSREFAAIMDRLEQHVGTLQSANATARKSRSKSRRFPSFRGLKS